MYAIKKQSPFIFAFLLLSFIAAIMLLPLEGVLKKLNLSDFQIEYVNLTIKMGVLFVISLRMIYKLKLPIIAGLSAKYPWDYKYLNFIPVYLFIIGLSSIVFKDISQIEVSNLLLLLVACLTVGFAEEFMFRGLLQSIFLSKYITQKNGVLKSVFISALFFGLFHLINLLKNDNSIGVFIQVVYATFIGFFFGVLLLRTNKLIPLAITHGLINFFFSLSMLPNIKNEAANTTSMELGVLIAPLILFLPLFIIAFLVIQKVKKEAIAEKLLKNEPSV